MPVTRYGQLQRMNSLVSYQLSRAASGGHKLFATPIEILPQAEQIVVGLEKIYAVKGVLCEFEVDEAVRFHGETGDLRAAGWPVLHGPHRWRLGELTVPWSAVAPDEPGWRVEG